MPLHFRMADALCETHLMACNQKKIDIAEIILQALEVESENYGASHTQKREGKSLLTIAQQRHQQLEDEIQAN